MSQPPPPQPNHKGVPKQTLVIVGAMVTVMFLALAFVGYRWMQSDALAVLVELSGQAERDTAKALEEWQPAKNKDQFEDGDGARTAQAATATFTLINGARLKLKPASQIRFKTKHEGGEASLGVEVAVGQADIETGSGGITIDSEFGAIVIDANSTMSMTREGDRLMVGVELGSLQFGDGTRRNAGETLELELGGIVVEVADPEPVATATASAEPEEPKPPELSVGDGVSAVELKVDAGDSFVVHDPNPPTAIGFNVGTLCDGEGAQLSSGSQKTEARALAGLKFAKGNHGYEIRCVGQPKVVVAKGRVRVLKDAGTRPLPSFAPKANVTTDGRRYTVLYQNRLPRVTVSWPSAPQADGYTLSVGTRTIQTQSPSYTFASLRRGSHRIVFAANSTPKRQSRTTTVEVKYDTQAPAARVAFSPASGREGKLKLSGQALPGWSVSVSGKQLPVDGAQAFSTELDAAGTPPIMFSHPSRGTHYYLRR